MLPYENLDTIKEVPDYATRADAQASLPKGETLAPFIPLRRVKGWRILQPDLIVGAQTFDFDGTKMIIFPRAFFGKVAADGVTGVLESMVISWEEAVTFNLPPDGPRPTGEKPARPVPLKPLGPRQIIMRQPGFVSSFVVRNLDVPLESAGSGDGSFTVADRADLKSILEHVSKIGG